MDILRSELHRKLVLIKLHRTCSASENPQTDCEIWAEGDKDSKIFLGEEAKFLMRTPTHDLFLLTIKVVDPLQREIDVGFRCKEEKIHELLFRPATTGVYTMTVEWDGHSVEGSPFTVAVIEKLE